ncbi:MAG: redoxin domain-containing protein [Terrimonas sp.]|nr:redoxin domain-containing protein [Terrimonas sp.]
MKNGIWRAFIIREDGNPIIFNMRVKNHRDLFILNDRESIPIRDIVFKKDSVNFNMPFFESYFISALQKDGSLKGNWIKGTAGATQRWDFYAYPNQSYRFSESGGDAMANISGKWEMELTRNTTGYTRKALAELVQKGNRLTGTVITPSGDYRYLEGIVSGDSLKLSTFDGAHAYMFAGKLLGDRLLKGVFYSGFAGVEEWVAEKNASALPPEISPTDLKDGYSRLDFSFKDINGNVVSLRDPQFSGKIVVIQLMGSWCPNCMDETKFLSDYYNKHQKEGIEVIALAYEYSEDFERSQKSLRKFQKAFDVQYPMLITGVSVSDSLKTEKSLPQLNKISVYPTTIFIGRDGNVKSIHTGFYGPGSGEYFEAYKKEFQETIDRLQAE